MVLKQKALNGTKWTSISTIALLGFQLLQLVVLARLLEASAYGLMGMVLIIIGFAEAFTDMGISNAIIYRQDVTGKQLSSLYWLNIFSGLAVFGVIWGITPLIVSFFNEPQLTELIHWISFMFLLSPIGQQFQALLQKELKFNLIAKIEIVSAAIATIVAILTAYFGSGVLALVWGQLLNSGLKAVLFGLLGFRFSPPKWHFKYSDLEGFLSFGLYQMGERTVNYLNTRIDTIIIGKLLGANLLGYYTFASNIIYLPSSKINPIINRVAFPVFSKMQKDDERLKTNFFKVLTIISIINAPIFFGLFVTAPIVVPTIFGDQWTKSILILQILCGVGILRSVGNPIGSLLMAKGRADVSFRFNVFKMITQIPGIIIGAYLGGITGVAIVYLVLQVFYTIASYFYLIKKVIGPCAKLYFKSIIPAFLISSVMSIIVWGTGQLLSAFPDIFILISQILVGLIIYLLLVTRLKNEAILDVKKIISKKLKVA